MRVVTDLETIGAARWNALVDVAAGGQPFLRFEFLDALHSTGCASAKTGWEPHYLALFGHDKQRLLAAAPLYRKSHSYGEYVFDWAWADAHHRHNVPYYPKWLIAVPFTPVPGPRLLAVDSVARERLADELLALVGESEISSLHVLFERSDDLALLEARGLLTRTAVQFHWFNRGYSTFADYLSALTQPKRKKVRAERRKVSEASVQFVRKVGSEIDASDWEFFWRCYSKTYAEHHSTPYLTPRFFRRLAATMADHLLLIVARREHRPIGCALALFDSSRLYGRYWGATESVPCLHFETAYYQMIEFAIERGLSVFEGGAQGEHKHARGFEPVRTVSSHALTHPAFAVAVERYLDREADGVEAYVDELAERSALKTTRDLA